VPSARARAARPAVHSAPRRGGGTLLLLGVVVLALIVHRRALGAGWGPDDLILLEQARGMRAWAPGPWRVLSGPLFWSMAAAIGDPRRLHLFTWLLHGLTVALLWAFARANGASRGVAALAAALFGLHPATVDAVVPISSVGEVLSAALMLATLTLTVRASRPRALAGPSVLWALALLAKESVALAPLGTAATAPRRLARFAALAFAMIGGLFLASLRFAGETPGGVAYAWGWGPNVLRNLLVYAGTALAPWRALSDPAAATPGVLGPAGLAVLALGAALAWRTTRVPALGLALFVTALGPVLLLRETRHAHYLYLPLAGLAVAVASLAALAVDFVLRRLVAAPRAAAAAAAALAVLVIAHAALAEWTIARRYAARIATLELPLDPMLRKMEVAHNALGAVASWAGPEFSKLLILEPPGSGAAFSTLTGRTFDRSRVRPAYDLLSAVIDSGRGIPAAFPNVREAWITDRWEPRWSDWMLATNMVNGQLLLCGTGWEGHAKLATYWAMSKMAPQALAHVERVLAADSSQAGLRVVRDRLVALVNGSLTRPVAGASR